MALDRSLGCWIILLTIWILINGADAAWIYFYIYSSIHPNPRSPVNITHSGWTGYKVMMFLFGFPWGVVNLGVFWLYFASGRRWYSIWHALFNLFIVVPVSIIMILGPFISPFVALPIAQQHAWNHGCDRFPIQVVLSAKGYNAPSYQPNTAQYFQGSTPLYTYDIFQPSADTWSFNIRTIDSPALRGNMSSPLYPSISNITYNFVDNTASGNCTSPSSNTSFACVTGSFELNSFLSFNLTDLRTNSSTNLRAVDKQWAFSDDAPSVILKDNSGMAVVQTDVTAKSACQRLKVCAGEQSGAGITVPIGLILLRQMDYAIQCTTPSND